MPKQSVPLPTGTTSRSEKMSILSTLLGPDALAKLREGLSDPKFHAVDADVEVNADRAAWHRNKLLERLRGQSTRPNSTLPPSSVVGQMKPPSAPNERAYQRKEAQPVVKAARPTDGLDARLAAIVDTDTIDQEHPAVIARLLRGLPREERIVVLKALPGPIARSIVRRLR